MQELINNLNIIKNATSEVYEAGQENAVDADKIIEKSVSGNRFVTANDVSEVRHDVTINTTGDCNVMVYGKNLFNIETSVPGALSNTNGGVASGNASYDTSDYIKVYEGITYTMNSGRFVCVYDADKKFISGVSTGTAGKYTYTIPSGATYLRFSYTKGKIDTQFEVGTVSTRIETYIEPSEYTIQNGTITIPSLSPYMTVIADSDVNIVMNYRKSYGMQTEYDRFWDNFQNYGNRTDYWMAFAGTPSWLISMYGGVPKYDIILKDTSATTRYCYSMFYAFNRDKTLGERADMTEICKHIDFSGCISTTNLFKDAKADNITCDFSSATSLNGTFACSDGGQMNNITIKVTEKCTNYSNAFSYASRLIELRFTDDSTIVANLDLMRSTQLSHDSIVNVINTLSSVETGKTISLSKTAVNTAFETSAGAADGSTSTEWTNLVATKSNWTFSLS